MIYPRHVGGFELASFSGAAKRPRLAFSQRASPIAKAYRTGMSLTGAGHCVRPLVAGRGIFHPRVLGQPMGSSSSIDWGFAAGAKISLRLGNDVNKSAFSDFLRAAKGGALIANNEDLW
jgi:hypothetical protein